MQPFKLAGPTKRATNPGLFSNKKTTEEVRDFKAEGVSLAERGEFKQALLAWSTAVSLTPGDHEIYEMQAQALLELEEPFKAIKIAEKCVALAPNYVFGYLTLGRAQLNFGEPELALETFKQAARFAQNLDELQEEMRRVAEILDQKKSVLHVLDIQTKAGQAEDEDEPEAANTGQDGDKDTVMSEG